MSLLVSPDWLGDHLGDPKVRIVDASWYLPAQNRNPRAEFEAGHIPGAVFFDIDAIADPDTDLPHMLPDADRFAAAVGALGIAEDDIIVVYDSAGLLSAPRVWWTFRVFGAPDVRVLDGGLPAWTASGHALQTGPARPAAKRFRAREDRRAVADFDRVRAILDTKEAQVVDARSAARFAGTAPEPRPELSSGHMPGALNLPYDRLVREGRLVGPGEVRSAFTDAGVDLGRPVVTSCGSGITASVLAFALAAAGKDDVAVYDGSWTEWAARADAPIVKEPR